MNDLLRYWQSVYPYSANGITYSFLKKERNGMLGYWVSIKKNLFLYVVFLIFFVVISSEWTGNTQEIEGYSHCYYISKPEVGKLVLGPHGKPILAEYDSNRKLIRLIGEAIGDLENIYYMYPPDYQADLKNVFKHDREDFKNIFTHKYEDRLMSRLEYERTIFKSSDGEVIEKPALKKLTQTIMTTTERSLKGPLPMCEYPIDCRLMTSGKPLYFDKKGRGLPFENRIEYYIKD